MHDERFARIKHVFAAAIERPPDERHAYLDDACAGDEELRREVESLLRTRSDERVRTAGAALDLTSGAEGRLDAGMEQPGSTIGPYTLERQIGEGGFGAVFAAEQSRPVRRRVAIKIIKPGMDSRQVVARFEQERQALAVLDHPNIAKVLDAGATPQGRPFFVMELVRGEPLSRYCDRRALPIRERLALFICVCEAVQHAHHKGIIHRDLKPSNILVTEVEGRPEPKVIDFGIAKAIGPALTDMTLHTQDGVMIGTPEYISPEQAAGGGVDVDTRTDVYSLGVVLYELLAGVLPFDSVTLRGAGFLEMQRMIREVDPPRPSARLMAVGAAAGGDVARRRGASTDALARELRRELEWIPMKAVRKDRTERYDTPSDLARDVRNYLEGRPLVAAPESAVYRVRKYVRRNRGPVVAAGAVAATLVTGSALAFWQRGEAIAARDEAVRREGQTRAVTDLLTRALVKADPMQGGEGNFTVRQAMNQASGLLAEGALKDDPQTEAELQRTIAEILSNNADFEGALPLATASLATMERLHGPDHHDVAMSVNTLATILEKQGRLDEADALYRRGVAILEQVHGPSHPLLASALNNMAGNLYTQGKYAAAEPLYARALAILERAHGPDHPDLFDPLNNLAALHKEQGHLDSAEQNYLRALAIMDHSGKGDDTRVAICLRNLATLYNLQARAAEAEPLIRRAIEVSERALGPEHPSVAQHLNELGTLYVNQGRFDDAEPVMRRALEIRERLLGPMHPAVAEGLNNLGVLYYRQGRIPEVEPLFRRALEIREKVLDPQSPLLAFSLNSLAAILVKLQRPAEAEPLLGRALGILEKAVGPEHIDVAMVLNTLATLHMEQGRPEEAEPLHARALAIHEHVLGPEHPRVALSLHGLATVACREGRFAEAEPLCRRALAIREKALGPNHPDVSQSLHTLATILAKTDHPEEAADLEARAGEIDRTRR
jgi:serine/threonine protein kinase/tetratricopeptide (TPR) repeat protein